MARQRYNREMAYVEKHWTLDKRIPVTLILTLSIHIATSIWWASGLTKDVQNLTDSYKQLARTVEAQGSKLEQVGPLKVELEGLKKSVDKLESTLDRAIEKLSYGKR